MGCPTLLGHEVVKKYDNGTAFGCVERAPLRYARISASDHANTCPRSRGSSAGQDRDLEPEFCHLAIDHAVPLSPSSPDLHEDGLSPCDSTSMADLPCSQPACTQL